MTFREGKQALFKYFNKCVRFPTVFGNVAITIRDRVCAPRVHTESRPKRAIWEDTSAIRVGIGTVLGHWMEIKTDIDRTLQFSAHSKCDRVDWSTTTFSKIRKIPDLFQLRFFKPSWRFALPSTLSTKANYEEKLIYIFGTNRAEKGINLESALTSTNYKMLHMTKLFRSTK